MAGGDKIKDKKKKTSPTPISLVKSNLLNRVLQTLETEKPYEDKKVEDETPKASQGVTNSKLANPTATLSLDGDINIQDCAAETPQVDASVEEVGELSKVDGEVLISINQR